MILNCLRIHQKRSFRYSLRWRWWRWWTSCESTNPALSYWTIDDCFLDSHHQLHQVRFSPSSEGLRRRFVRFVQQSLEFPIMASWWSWTASQKTVGSNHSMCQSPRNSNSNSSSWNKELCLSFSSVATHVIHLVTMNTASMKLLNEK